MRRIWAFLLAAVLIAGVFAGCSPADDTTGATTQPTQASTSAGETTTTEETTTETTTQQETQAGSTQQSVGSAATTTKKSSTTTQKATAKAAAKTGTPFVSGATFLDSWSASGNGVTANVQKLQYQGYVFYLAKVTCTPAKLHMVSAEQLISSGRMASSKNRSVSGRATASVSEMAAAAGAVIALNGQNFEGHNSSYWDSAKKIHLYRGTDYKAHYTIVLENKLVKKSTDSKSQNPKVTFWNDGHWSRTDLATNSNAQSMISSGLKATVYGEPTYWDGKKVSPSISADYSNGNKNDNRTALGRVDNNTYYLALGVNASTGSITDLLIASGAKQIYQGNGGNCSILWLKGQGILNPLNSSSPCAAIDFYYFG